MTTVSFPGLGIGEFPVNSEAFSIGGAPIAWYALIICFGMIFAVGYVIYRAGQIGINSDHIIDFALFVIPFGVLGARLYYVIMDLENFDSFAEVLNIRGGGLAIYGGIIAGAITVFCVCLYKKIDFLAFADCVVPGLIMAQSIGRWGNFMNGEAFGGITDWFCRMGLRNSITYNTFGTNETVFVHPTFLYESLWNLSGVLLVYLFSRFVKKKYDGQLILLTFGWYGLGRMFIEGLRTDSLMIGDTGIRVSQALAALLLLVCLVLLIVLAIVKPKVELYQRPQLAEDEKLGSISFKDRVKYLFVADNNPEIVKVPGKKKKNADKENKENKE